MRIVVQRVTRATVRVAGQAVGAIAGGILLYVGVAPTDTPEQARRLAGKVARLRIFADEDGRMNRDLAAAGGSALVISQFTLYGDSRRGNRPSYLGAAAPALAESLYDDFCAALTAEGVAVARGVFGAHMIVESVNDGPVTLWLDSEAL